MLMFEALNDALPLGTGGCAAGPTSGNTSAMFPLILAAIALMLLRKDKKRHDA